MLVVESPPRAGDLTGVCLALFGRGQCLMDNCLYLAYSDSDKDLAFESSSLECNYNLPAYACFGWLHKTFIQRTTATPG